MVETSNLLINHVWIKHTSAPNHPNSGSWVSPTHQSKATFSRSFWTCGQKNCLIFFGCNLPVLDLAWAKHGKHLGWNDPPLCPLVVSPRIWFLTRWTWFRHAALLVHSFSPTINGNLCIHIHRHIDYGGTLVYHPQDLLPTTTGIIPFVVRNPYKPLFVILTGWGVDPNYPRQILQFII